MEARDCEVLFRICAEGQTTFYSLSYSSSTTSITSLSLLYRFCYLFIGSSSSSSNSNRFRPLINAGNVSLVSLKTPKSWHSHRSRRSTPEARSTLTGSDHSSERGRLFLVKAYQPSTRFRIRQALRQAHLRLGVDLSAARQSTTAAAAIRPIHRTPPRSTATTAV